MTSTDPTRERRALLASNVDLVAAHGADAEASLVRALSTSGPRMHEIRDDLVASRAHLLGTVMDDLRAVTADSGTSLDVRAAAATRLRDLSDLLVTVAPAITVATQPRPPRTDSVPVRLSLGPGSADYEINLIPDDDPRVLTDKGALCALLAVVVLVTAIIADVMYAQSVALLVVCVLALVGVGAVVIRDDRAWDKHLTQTPQVAFTRKRLQWLRDATIRPDDPEQVWMATLPGVPEWVRSGKYPGQTDVAYVWMGLRRRVKAGDQAAIQWVAEAAPILHAFTHTDPTAITREERRVLERMCAELRFVLRDRDQDQQRAAAALTARDAASTRPSLLSAYKERRNL